VVGSWKEEDALPQKKEDGLQLVWLEAFVAAAEKKSYSLASRRLNVSQPSITRYVARLEAWLRKLLIAQTHPVRLTEHGEAFLPVAREVIATLTSNRAQLPSTLPEKAEKRSAKDIRL
jgi:DNA-binding transcriptional LysR family regulator